MDVRELPPAILDNPLIGVTCRVESSKFVKIPEDILAPVTEANQTDKFG
jgi:hypothetical protein